MDTGTKRWEYNLCWFKIMSFWHDTQIRILNPASDFSRCSKVLIYYLTYISCCVDWVKQRSVPYFFHGTLRNRVTPCYLIVAFCPHFLFPCVMHPFYLWSQDSFINTDFTSKCKNRTDLGDFLGPSNPKIVWFGSAVLNNAYMLWT